jgi:mono/diheme cytochrome c family protein
VFSFNKSQSVVVSVLLALILIAGTPSSETIASDASTDVITNGERLVHNMDCNVCHTPKVFTPEGPKPDTSRLLSGHPANEVLPSIPKGLISPQGWGGIFNNSLTAWVGPWGVSFGSNLTPDHKTGIGSWTEEIFIQSMRTGTHVGNARPFLPPMPTYSRLTDAELHSMYMYLRSIKPIKNAVPAPVPPPQPAQ